jgi:hypothetical protein
MAKRKRVRVAGPMDRQLKAMGFSYTERLKAFDEVRTNRTVAALAAVAHIARHTRRK